MVLNDEEKRIKENKMDTSEDERMTKEEVGRALKSLVDDGLVEEGPCRVHGNDHDMCDDVCGGPIYRVTSKPPKEELN